jgi:paired amphipathic helix protein Sin3a
VEEVCRDIERLFANYTALYESFGAFLPSYDGDSPSEEEDVTTKRQHALPKPAFAGSLQACNKYIIEDLSEPFGKNESHFFHRVKNILQLNSPPGYDYFNEFTRCLDLYSTCIIIKSELLVLIEPLFEVMDIAVFVHPAYMSIKKSANKEEHAELQEYVKKQLTLCLDTFRVMLSTRETSRRKTGWFFKPLGDLDTSGNKRHGHSYIAPNRPRAACSGRTPLISSYLNSQWVSVPYGSEDFSFRHMRKNPYEDALFKTEDERFDSDLAIEQIKFTLNLLQDALEEIKRLPADQQRDYHLDKKLFSATKLKPIYNVYGDHGPKFRELLEQDPVRSLPVIIQRLNAKLEAWLASSKQEKERVWKETAEKNFSKSLDHRSFYFKQNEKRFANNKSFLSEAKLRYDHRFQAHKKLLEYVTTSQCDFDYEFLGGSKNKVFYSSFAGLSYGVPHFVPDDFKDDLIAHSRLVFPQVSTPAFANLREAGRLPQFRLLFNSQAALDDSLRIMLFALDKNIASKDKVRKWLKALYQDFLDSPIPDDLKSGNLDEVFGPLETEENAAAAEEPKKKKGPNEQVDPVQSLSDDDLSVAVAEQGSDSMVLKRDVDFQGFLPLLQDSAVFYAPVSIYVFFRFLYTVYERLLKVKFILAQVYDGRNEDTQPLIPGGKYSYSEKVEAEYQKFMRTVCMVLRGLCDTSKYEDQCRQILVNDSYVLFTFDKLVTNTVKSVLAIVQDDQALKSFALFLKYRRMPTMNEEMYLAEYFHATKPPVVQAPSFRLLWNAKMHVMSVTYLESPYEKLQAHAIEAASSYFHSFLGSEGESQCPLTKELRPFQRKIDRYFVNNQVGELLFSRSLQVSQHIHAGLTENSMKLQFIPGGEDVVYSSHFLKAGKIVSYAKEDDCLYSFSDKNSFVQKMTEMSEKAFKTWHEKWLSAVSKEH